MSAPVHVLDRLDGVRQQGDSRWTALCPAHDDHRPSLGVALGDGCVLLRCYAGCATKDVLDALQLTWRDLFDEER